MGGAMLSKSLIRFSVDGRGCAPSLLFDQTMVELMKIMVTFFKRPCVHCCTQCPPTLQQATAHASSGDSWILKGKSGSVLVGSLLFSPGSWCTQGSVCARQESVSQSCRSSGSSVVGLMATSSKTAYAIPRSTARRAPALAAVHC